MRCLIAVLLAFYAVSAGAQLYRWTDASGRVHYTDTPPPPGASSVEKKRATASGSDPESNPAEPFVLQKARRDFPVKLYSAPNCEPCQAARDLLNKRGVPFSEVSINGDPDQLEELQKTTGVSGVPALLVGKSTQSGFEAAIYHRMLDEGGYPKMGMLAPRSQVAPKVVSNESPPGAPTPAPSGPYAPESLRR